MVRGGRRKGEVKINEKEGGGRFAHVRESRLGIDSNEIGYAEC